MTRCRDSRPGTHMETNGGRYFCVSDPQPDEVSIDDIATSLSNLSRFNGHVRLPYSVAEHSILVMRLVLKAGHPELALPALHHDSHEGYGLGDMPPQVKDLIGRDRIGPIVAKIDEAIAAAFGFDVSDLTHPIIKLADEEALRQEAAVMKHSGGVGEHWGYTEPPVPLHDWTPGISQHSAAHLFRWLHWTWASQNAVSRMTLGVSP